MNYNLVSFPSQLDKTNGTNATIIPDFEQWSTLNAAIFTNRIDPAYLKMHCNVTTTTSNEYSDSARVDEFQIIPNVVKPLEYQMFEFNTKNYFAFNNTQTIQVYFTDPLGNEVTFDKDNPPYIKFVFE